MLMKNVKGISLVALIITIIVLIILTGAVMLLMNQSDTIGKANEAVFKNDIATFKEELTQYILNKQVDTTDNFDKNTLTKTTYEEIKEVIKSFTKEYENKVIIYKGDLASNYSKLNEKELRYVTSLNIVNANDYIIPNEYQQVEYIESTGTQYINTGISGNYILNIDVEFISKGGRNLMGHNTNAGYYFGINENNLYEIGGGVVINNSNALERGIVKFDHDIINMVTKLTVNDVKVERIFSFVDNESTFNICGGLSNGYSCLAKVYNAKFYQNDLLVRNMIPCYRKSDTTIGMYDTVNNVFYENAGNDTFLKGNDVN